MQSLLSDFSDKRNKEGMLVNEEKTIEDEIKELKERVYLSRYDDESKGFKTGFITVLKKCKKMWQK